MSDNKPNLKKKNNILKTRKFEKEDDIIAMLQHTWCCYKTNVTHIEN